jgi:alginate O-acetyltransferase complex protein AlgI
MTFTTLTFLIFLIVVFTLYWSVKTRRAQNVILVIADYIFYGWWDWRFCLLMLGASLVDFFVGLGLNRATDPTKRKWILGVGLTCNLVTLGFFKYFNFFAESFQSFVGQLGWQVDPITVSVILPVGISFYTFQTMSYSIDVYRGRMRATNHVIEYLAYVSFFPQLVAGPIERAPHLLPQFLVPRVFSNEQAISGCKQALWGLFKKMAVANNLAPIVDAAFANPGNFNAAELALATAGFAIQIYCDFSGYSDIAVGVSRLFGFELMRNFAYPYFSQSVGEFWRRWHISLSSWFKDYVYFPLGGSRVAKPRMAFNVMITFVLSGLWHGASWNFVIWGAMNGLGVLPELLRTHHRRTSTDVPAPNVTPATILRILGTFFFICATWIFFRAPTFDSALLVYERLATAIFSPAGGLLRVTDVTEGRVWIAVGVLLVAEWIQRSHWHPLQMPRWHVGWRWAGYTVLLWTVIYLGTYSTSPFIYFQF